MQRLKQISFALLGLITLILAAITIAEYRDPDAGTLYTSPWLIALWATAAACSLAYLWLRRSAMSVPTAGIHAALLLILAGAAITHFCGFSGKIRLESHSAPVRAVTTDDGAVRPLPFGLTLDSCYIEYYPGSHAARDYVSELGIDGYRAATKAKVAMNKVLEIDSYRFYQTALGPGYSVLSVSHDPVGIAVSYSGYALLLLSMAAFYISGRSRFRSLARKGAICLCVLCHFTATAADTPQTLPEPLARNLGKLHVYYADRVMPLQTLARDFCLKVYGKESFRGLTAEQVLAGWLFYYDEWKRTPFIKTEGELARRLSGTGSSHAALTDFYSPQGYRLEKALAENLTDRKLHDTDERINLLTQVLTGKALRIFPVTADGECHWYSWVDTAPASLDVSDYAFVISVFGDVAREVAHRQWKNADDRISEIRSFQISNCPPEFRPGDLEFSCEIFYNRYCSALPPAILAITAGFLLFFFSGKGKSAARWSLVPATVLFIWTGIMLTLRGIVSRHLPLANGYETMLSLAWLALGTSLCMWKRMPLLRSGGMLVAGLALMVAYIGRSGATVSHLMPVLASPLLSVHVLLVMCSYALFALIWFNSIAAFVRPHPDKESACARSSLLLLYPAVMLLAAGIFIGAVWANQSWGRYWGWDPKETWALITMLIYALPLHAASWPAFRRPKVVNMYLFAAFLTVLMTYFGVNFLLRGLHSYA